jgi:hypothetical protein
MATKKFPLVRGRHMRATRTDGCGRPIYGDCARIVTDGVVSVALTGNYSETDAIDVPNWGGRRCVFVPARRTFANFTAVITFCEVDPELFSMLSGQDVLYDPYTGDAIGWRVEDDIDPTATAFALELWMEVPNVACSDAGQGSFGYMLLPYLQGGSIGDVTIENNAVNFSITGANTQAGSQWGSGPYDVMFDAAGNPAPLHDPVTPREHQRVFYTEIAPPAITDGCQPLVQPMLTVDDQEVTDLALVLTLSGDAPVPDSPGFVVIDWGDGTAQEVMAVVGADPGTGAWTGLAVDHDYAEPGLYDVRVTYYSVIRNVEATIGSS